MLCLKASRGAGMEWGLAEEAGHAVRWLRAAGLDGTTPLLALLRAMEDRWDAARPVAPDELRARDGGPLCPIATGALLSDLNRLPDRPVGPVAAPVLLLPFLRHPARAAGRAVVVAWEGGTATVGGDGRVGGRPGALAAMPVAAATLAHAPEAPAHRPSGAHPAWDVLAALDALAMRTTVPASRSSVGDAGAAVDED